MFFSKMFTLTLFFCALLVPFTSLKAGRPIIQMDSLEEARKHITSLPAGSKPGCVIDFHGVTVEQTSHTPPLNLKKGSKEFLKRLNEQDIPFVISSGWFPFQAVQDEVVKLGIAKLLKVESTYKAPLETIVLEDQEVVEVETHSNGHLVSARLPSQNEDALFTQKASAFEVKYPNADITHLLVFDDSLRNLRTIEKNFEQTTYSGRCELMLFYVGSNENYSLSLSKSRDEERLSSSSLSLPSSNPIITVTPEASESSSDSGSDHEEDAEEEEASSPLQLRSSAKSTPPKPAATPVSSSSDSESEEEDVSPPLTDSDEE
ncbi:MAG: hypothetical protein K2W92_04425 [Alphaproteobacteria bacterium]|nr:hypothetical protein [Alphaproteobacteria bacterium]